MHQLRVLPLGACGLHGPLDVAIKTGAIGKARMSRNGLVPSTYSFGEIFQLMATYRGEFTIPAELRALCDLQPHCEPLPHTQTLDGVDVILVEPNVPIDLKFRQYCLNRVGIIGKLLDPLKRIVPDIAKPANVWFNKGLMAVNDSVRAAAAEQMLRLIPSEFGLADLAREVFVETRGVRHDTTSGLKRLRSITSLPMGVVSYVYQYLPDGQVTC